MLKSRIEKLWALVGLRPFFLLGNVIGIISCNYVKKRVIPGGIITRLYVILISGIRIYLSYAFLSFGVDRKSKLLISVTSIMSTISLLLATTIDFFISVFRQNRYVKFFEKLDIYDERVAKLGHPHQDQYSWYWIFVGLMCGSTYRLFNYIYVVERDWRIFLLKAAVTFALAILYRMCLWRYVLLVHLLYQRFRHLNKSIFSNVSWTRKLSPQNLKSVTSDDVLFLHATLLDASIIINDTFSIIQICNFSTIFFTTTIDIYKITDPIDKPSPQDKIARLIFCVSAIGAAFVTCAVCHITAEEANNTGKYMVKDEPTLIEDSTAMDRVRMQLYLLHNRVIFRCGEFFAICLPSCFSMVVSSITWSALLSGESSAEVFMKK